MLAFSLLAIFSLALHAGFGAAVVINRNPIASALSLVVSFLGLAALFMMLDAYFIGVIQVLVYAGAVMVLVSLHHHAARSCAQKSVARSNVVAVVGGVLVALALFFQIYCVVHQLRAAEQPFPRLPMFQNRRRSQCRTAPVRSLQSAVSNHRHSGAGRDGRRHRPEQTRAALT